MNMSVDNGDVNGDYFYMDSSTRYESNDQSSFDYTKKRDEIYINRCLIEHNGWPYSARIDVMLPASMLNQYDNMECNNKHHNLLSHGDISTSKKPSVSTFTSPYITSTNY